MCGRMTLTKPTDQVLRALGLTQLPLFSPRYNIAPTQLVPVVLYDREQGQMVVRSLRWGLVPGWADDLAIGNRMINARSESAASKPAFRAAMRYRRCLVCADGFYEWQRRGKVKQPFYIRRRDGQMLGVAGLWESWSNPQDGQVVETFTVLTTAANELVMPLHDRMPLILEPEEYRRWLDPQTTDPALLADLLRPAPAEKLEAFPVSTLVNTAATEDARCVEPAEAPPGELF